MGRRAALVSGLFFIGGCTHVPFDYSAFNSNVNACYFGVTPDDVRVCLDRVKSKDPAYPMTFEPGNGAFCSPDLNKRECRDFLESANEPFVPSSTGAPT